MPPGNAGLSLYLSSILHAKKPDICVNGITGHGGGMRFPKAPPREPHPAGSSASVLARLWSRTVLSWPVAGDNRYRAVTTVFPTAGKLATL